MPPHCARPLLLIALAGLSSCHPASGVARPAGRPDPIPGLCARLRAPRHAREGEGLAEAAARYAVCARVHSADPAELKRRMDRAGPAWTSDKDVYGGCGSEEVAEATECPKWLSEIIRIAPPVRVRRPEAR